MPHDDPTGVDSERPPRVRQPRWGVRTLWLLGLAFVAMIGSNVLHDNGVDYWGLVTFAAFWCGILGAAYCTYRGLREFSWLQK